MIRSEISEELKEAKHAAVNQFMDRVLGRRQDLTWAVRAHPHHNVVGVGIGRKIKQGRSTKKNCVRLYVENKIPLNSIPRDFLLPERIGNVVTDVIETGLFRALQGGVPANQKRLRPARPGCSIGFQFPNAQAGELMAGTFGAMVTANGDRYVLSNNHVLANENALPIGTAIFQPGLLDGGNPFKDQIATLAGFVPLNADKPNLVDCALAKVLDGATVSSKMMPKIGQLASAEPIEAAEGMQVEKTGRATGYTTGTVFEVAATIAVQFDLGMLTFENQLMIRSDAGVFSDGGDSGAIVVDRESGRATGLLIGGVSQFAIANHISDVLQALNVQLIR